MELRLRPKPVIRIASANKGIISKKEYFVEKMQEQVKEHPYLCQLLRCWKPKASLIYPGVPNEHSILYQYDINRNLPNIFSEDEAEEIYLRNPPPYIVVLGKQSFKMKQLTMKIADYYGNVPIDVESIVKDVILSRNKVGEFLDRVLRTGASLSVNFLMALLSYKAHSAIARHRGYVISGLPCLSLLPEISVEQQLNYLFLWDCKPNMFINVLDGDEEMIVEKSQIRYDFLEAVGEFQKIISAKMKEEDEPWFEDEQDELLPIKSVSIPQENDINIEPSRPWLTLDKDESFHIISEMELFEQKAKPIIDLFAARVDPQCFRTVDVRIGNEFEMVQAYLSMMPFCKSPVAIPFIKRKEIDLAKDTNTNLKKNGLPEEEMTDSLTGENPENVIGLSAEEAFPKLFSTNVISTKFRHELSHYNYVCPVTFRDGDIVMGKPEFAVSFMKYIYFLRDEDAMLKFMENPRYYVLPVIPKPLYRAIIVGYPYSGKTKLAQDLARQFSIPIIDLAELAERDRSVKIKAYREFCREKAMAREVVRLTAEAWNKWREEENERVALIEEWLEYIQDLLGQRINLFYDMYTKEAKDEQKIKSHLPDGEKYEEYGDVDIEDTNKERSKKFGLEVRGTTVSLSDSNGPYDGEKARGKDSYMIPSKKIIQTLKHESCEFNENGVEVEADLCSSASWNNFAENRRFEQSEKVADLEVKAEEQEKSSTAEESVATINWATFLPPQSVSSFLLAEIKATVREKRKSFTALLLAAKETCLAPSALKAEFSKWRLPFMDVKLCEKFYDNPLLLLHYCPEWLKERPVLPEPVDATHPVVIEAGCTSYDKTKIIHIEQDEEILGMLLSVAVEKAEKDGMRCTGEVITPGGWVIDNICLSKKIWDVLYRENVRPNYIYSLIDNDPTYERIVRLLCKFQPHHTHRKISEKSNNEKDKFDENEKLKSLFELGLDKNSDKEMSSESSLRNEDEIFDILNQNVSLVKEGDKELDKVFENIIKGKEESYYNTREMTSQSVLQADIREDPSWKGNETNMIESVVSSRSIFDYLFFPNIATHFNGFLSYFPIGPQLEKIPDDLFSTCASGNNSVFQFENSYSDLSKRYSFLLKTIYQLEKLEEILPWIDCKLQKIVVNGKNSEEILSEALKYVYDVLGKKPRELEPMELDEVRAAYGAAFDGGIPNDRDNTSPKEDIRIFGESGPFCIVNLERNILVRGKPEYVVKFYGKLYTFWDQEAKDRFMEMPGKYAPYYSVIRDLPPLKMCVVGTTGCGKTTFARSLSRHFGLFPSEYILFLNKHLLPNFWHGWRKPNPLDGQKLLISDNHNEEARNALLKFKNLPWAMRAFWLENPPYFPENEEEQNEVFQLLEVFQKTTAKEFANDELEDEKYFDFSDWLSFKQIEVFLKNYVNLGLPLPETLVEKSYRILWTKEPYASRGFIVDGFPFRSSDVSEMKKNNWFPDILFEVKLSEEDALKRNLDEVMKLWEEKLMEEMEEEERLEDVLHKIRNACALARKKKLFLEKNLLWPVNEGDRKQLWEEEKFYYGETESDGEGKEQKLPASKDSDFANLENEADFEVKEILKQEFPPLVFNANFESYDEGKNRLEVQLLDNYRKEIKEIDQIKEEFANLGIPFFQVDGNNMFSRNFIHLIRYIDKLKKKANNECEHAFKVDLATAEDLLQKGYYILSKFGRRCPVQMYNMKNPIHMYASHKEKGKVTAVAYRNYMYFVSGENEVKNFLENPLKYIFTETVFCHCALRLAVIGPPKCGKTTLSNKLADTFSLKVITTGSAIRFVLQCMPKSLLARSIDDYLRRGCYLPLSMKMEAVMANLNDPKCAAQGFVMDGFPFDAATAENLANRGNLPFVILSLKCDADFGRENQKNVDVGQFRINFKRRVNLRLRYEDWERSYRRFHQWNLLNYHNLYEVEAKRSKCDVFYSCYDIIRKAYFGILHYVEHCVSSRALRLQYLCISQHEFEMRKSSYQNNCPACWSEQEILKCSGDPPSRDGLVQYLEYIYWVCPTHIEKFLQEPKKFLPPFASFPPSTMPRIFNPKESLKSSGHELSVHGFGRCTVTKKDFPESLEWEGTWDCAIQYGTKIYLCKNEEMKNRFLMRPWRYCQVDVEFECNRLNSSYKSEAISSLRPLKLTSLPPVGFLEQTVARTIQDALNVVGRIRPIHPKLTATCTGCIMIALLLKVSNTCQENKNMLEKKYLEFMYKHCAAVRFTLFTFDRSAEYEKMCGEIEEESLISESSSDSQDDQISMKPQQQNDRVEENYPDPCWFDVDSQGENQNSFWSAKFIDPLKPKMKIEGDDLREISFAPKYHVMLKYQTCGMRTIPLPPVSNCLNFIYSLRNPLVIPEPFSYSHLLQSVDQQILEFPPAVIFNPHKEFSLKLYKETKPAETSEFHMYEANLSESTTTSEFERDTSPCLDPCMSWYMVKNFVPRFHLLDVLHCVDIPAVPRVLKDEIIFYNPQRDYSYCLLFSQFFTLSHYLHRICLNDNAQILEYLNMLDRRLELCDVQSTSFRSPNITKSSTSRNSIASYQDIFDAACTFFIGDDISDANIMRCTSSNKLSLLDEDAAQPADNVFWMRGESFPEDVYGESFEIILDSFGDASSESDHTSTTAIVLREVLPYPPLPWDTMFRPYYTYCSIPSIFSVPDVEDITHEKNVSLLDGIIEPGDEFRLVRFPSWVQFGAQDRIGQHESMRVHSKNVRKNPPLQLDNLEPIYFYYEFFNFHWSSLITYPFSWSYNLDLKDNWNIVTLSDRTQDDIEIGSLNNSFVEDIAVGTEHALILLSNGDVYGWGSNVDGQLGLNHTGFIREPQLISSLSNKNIKQVSTGRSHSAAWTSPPIPRKQPGQTGIFLGLPTSIPLQYEHLQGIPIQAICGRLQVLHRFSDMIYDNWRLMPLAKQGEPYKLAEFFSSGHLRAILSPRVSVIPMIQCISQTMIQGRNFGPQVLVRRFSTKGRQCKPIFHQISKQVIKMKPADLRLPSRAWKVKLVGEGADDAGGVFDDTITDICQELTNGDVDLLIPTPNSKNDIGFNRDRFILNPNHNQLSEFKFLGILFGVAIRTKKPLAIALAPLVWKLLVGESVTVDDLEEVDTLFTQSLRGIRDIHLSGVNETNFHELIPLECFETLDSTGKFVPVIPGGRNIPLTFENRFRYVDHAVKFRLQEMSLQIAAMRQGMAWIIPVPLLTLITSQRLEQLVCGLTYISIDLLKKAVRYRELDENHLLVQWLWSILESFTQTERVLFMRFVSGRSRLPANIADLSQRFQIMKVDRAVDGLPTAQTCFFQLRLPPYSSKEVMAEQLRYAINNCHSIDMDNYMLARNIDQGPPSDEEYQ